MGKYNNKYGRVSTRLSSWDYGSNALYFVTICCYKRVSFFGDISNGTMVRSEIGDMIEKYWLEIPQHFPFMILHNPHHNPKIVLVRNPKIWRP
ncbi:MAG: putative transposase [Luteibaculaceae bacterium]|jgi:putative transposase